MTVTRAPGLTAGVVAATDGWRGGHPAWVKRSLVMSDYASMSREELLAALEQLKARSSAAKTGSNPCFCGCGGVTKSRFVPGHDARFHSWAKAIARGERDMATTLADLPHDLAREEMERCVAHEIPIQQARAALAQRKASEKAAERLAKAEARIAEIRGS